MAEKRSDFKWTAIVLAAGSSTRMGRSKQLLKIASETLIRRTAKTAIDSGPNETLGGLGADSEQIKNELSDLSIQTITNTEFQKGMGSSLKYGLKYVTKKNSDAEAVMILVCDQPLLSSVHLKKIVEEYLKTKSPIVASFYSEKYGVPALFNKSMFGELLAIEDQHGAKKAIGQNPALVKSIDFPEVAVDLDTPADFENFRLQI